MACENEYEENVDSLRKLFSANNIVSFNIQHMKCSAGSSSGDNYMSVVKRIQIRGHRNTNDHHKDSKSIIIKRQIPSLSRRQLYRCDEAFCNEINAYNHIVPLLDRYMPDTIFPKCFYAGHDGKGEIIVLEDLKEEGFRMQNRIKGLELNHCEIVMKQLAKLHAASIAAKQLDNEMFRDKCKQVREIVYCKEAEEFYRNILETSIEESLDSLRTSNSDGCLTEPIKLIEKLQYKLFGKIQNSISNPTDHMSVMCHGDLWVNNIMFTTTNADCKEFDEEAYNGTNAINTTKSLPRDHKTRFKRRIHQAFARNLFCGVVSHAGEAIYTLYKGSGFAAEYILIAQYYRGVLQACTLWASCMHVDIACGDLRSQQYTQS
ncbi:uncharacterized protein LOC106094485 isoform X2 [Stomoxys calcitrans]|uniref:uncharacterized protein LOC106094485 isoform X2 n=1 Tax=Stomoxys calcitrans TaxID=35570 RepID=UPI0027E2A319|nr:uncharacterized protein LOC106094485 isoform X2 [Stomoxys calcitrans]